MLKWLVIFLVPFVPLVTKLTRLVTKGDSGIYHPLFFDLYTWYKGTFVIITAAISLIILITFIIKKRERLPYIIWVLSISYVFLTLLSSVFSTYKDVSFWGYPTLNEGALHILSYIALMLYGAHCLREEKALKILLVSLFVSLSIITLISFLEVNKINPFMLPIVKKIVFGNIPVIGDINRSTSVTASTLMNPNYIGSYISILLPLGFGLFFTSEKVKIFYSIFIFLATFLAILSDSRTGWIGTLVAISVLLVITYRSMRKKQFLIRLGLFAVILFIALGIATPFRPYFSKRFHSTVEEVTHIKVKPTKDNLKHFSVVNGELRVVTKNTDLLIKSINNELYFSHLNNIPLLVNIDKYEIKILEPGYDIYKFISKTDPVIGNYVEFSIEGRTISILPTSKGVKVFVWGRLWDSETPALFTIFSDEVFSTRGYLWARTIPMLKSSIFFGRGPGTYPLYFPQRDFYGRLKLGIPLGIIIDKPHNFYLQIAHGSGVIALVVLLILFLIFIIYALKTLRKFQINDYKFRFILGVFGSVIGFLVVGLCNDSNIGITPIFWFILGTGFGITSQQLSQILRESSLKA